MKLEVTCKKTIHKVDVKYVLNLTHKQFSALPVICFKIPSYFPSFYIKFLFIYDPKSKSSNNITGISWKLGVAVNPIVLWKTKIAYNFGLSLCNRVKEQICSPKNQIISFMSNPNQEGD